MASNGTFASPDASSAPASAVSPQFYGLVLEIAIVLVVLGNLLVMLALLSFRRWTAADVFLFSLSLADFLDCFVALQLVTVVKYFLQKPMVKPICDAFVGLVYTFRTASTSTVTLMAVERCLLITRPLKHHTAVTSKKIKKILVAVWIFSVITGTLPLMGFGRSGYQEPMCYYQLYDLGLEYAIFVEVYGVLMFFVVFVSYLAVKLAGSKFIKRQLEMAPGSVYKKSSTGRAPSTRARSDSQPHPSGVRGVQRLTVMLTLVVIFYYVSWLPFLLSNLVSLIRGQQPTLKTSMLTSVISLVHALLNPVLYGWMSQRYKAAYLFVFKTAVSPCSGKRPSRRTLSFSRGSSAPGGASNRRKSTANQNAGFEADEDVCKRDGRENTLDLDKSVQKTGQLEKEECNAAIVESGGSEETRF